MITDSESSETNIVIVTRKDSFVWFCKFYWRSLLVLTAPLLFLPIAFLGENDAYKCFYVFLISTTYWITDSMHPGVVALIPAALSSVMSKGFIDELYLRNELLDCLGVMIITVAVEQSQLHRRCCLKMLLVFGCSHYRLSFLVFFTSMLLSMWVTGIIACGLMMPLIKAMLLELEKMGMLEMYHATGKTQRKSQIHGARNPRPTRFTLFYFLGIAYSSSIGASATILGSQANQLLKLYCETLFPLGPKIEFPHFLLLNLPGVLILESILYLWMNFYFFKMCRKQSDMSLDIGMTEEEARYIKILLSGQYKQLGKITYYEWIIGFVCILTAILQPTVSAAYIINVESYGKPHNHFKVSSPCIFCAILLFIIPKNLDFIKFFKKRNENDSEALGDGTSDACLTWPLVRQNVDWSVLFIVGGSSSLFDALRDSHMTDELESFLALFSRWPSPALMLVIIVFFKLLTEFAPCSSVVYSLLPNLARLGIRCGKNPHYLMMAGTLSASLSCHLVAGSPTNAMVAAYVHIPPSQMLLSGIGVSVSAVAVAWFTVAAWASAVWSDHYAAPDWTQFNALNKHLN